MHEDLCFFWEGVLPIDIPGSTKLISIGIHDYMAVRQQGKG
jgi:hypothetical protein